MLLRCCEMRDNFRRLSMNDSGAIRPGELPERDGDTHPKPQGRSKDGESPLAGGRSRGERHQPEGIHWGGGTRRFGVRVTSALSPHLSNTASRQQPHHCSLHAWDGVWDAGASSHYPVPQAPLQPTESLAGRNATPTSFSTAPGHPSAPPATPPTP